MSIKLIYSFGVVSVCLSIIGYYYFFQLNLFYWFFALPIGIMSIYHILNYSTNLFWQPENRTAPKLVVYPDIDIFLPICGENIETLRNTWSAVLSLGYPGKIYVYVGDDKGDNPNLKNIVEKEFGFVYLSRQNKGFMKKTGNLGFLFKNSHSPFVIVFDADFCPKPEFIMETLPFMVYDKKIGILQTPQAFHKTENQFENSCSNTQFDFYRIIQKSRDYFGGAICVGSNAIFSREAIEKTNVYHWLVYNNIDHGEDVNTGFYLLNNGYKTFYLNKELAFGKSAENINQLIKQRNRWCSSSSKMFLSNIVAKSNITFGQKLCFYTGFLYYLTDIIKLILNYMVLFILAFHSSQLNLIYSLWFLPHILFGILLLPFLRWERPTKTDIAVNLSLVYINSYTFLKRIFGKGAVWVPTGAVNQNDKTVVHIKKFIKINTILYVSVFLYLVVANLIHFDNLGTWSLLFWVFVFIYTHFLLIKNYLS